MSLEHPIDTNAKTLLESVTQGLDFSVPNVDFNDAAFEIPEGLAEALKNVPDKLTIEMLTERKVDGAGCFDAIMKAMRVHLAEEYEAGRITGAEYTKAYIATMQVSLQQAVAYLLGKDQAFYQALETQAKALASNIDAYAAKVRLAIAQAQAHLVKAQYAGEVLKLGTIDKQTDQIMAQTDLTDAQTETQKQQKLLLVEQTEQAHSQVSDTRLDGTTPVEGYVGNQNSLLKQQVQSFKNDHIVKGAKIFADSFATQLSMSTATVDGTGLDAAGINKAVTTLQSSIAASAGTTASGS